MPARFAGRALRRAASRRGPPFLVGLLVLAAALAFRVAEPSLAGRARLAAFDAFQRAAPRAYAPAPVRVVDIDDASLARIGQWPWPRREVARLVDRLTALGAASIAFDVVFAEPDRTSPARLAAGLAALPEGRRLAEAAGALPDYDAELAAAFARSRVVAGFALVAGEGASRTASKAGFAVLGGELALAGVSRFGGAVPNLPALEAAASGNGSFTTVAGGDEVVRQVALLQTLDGSPLPSLAVEALRVAQGAKTLTFRADPDGGGTLRVGRVDVPVDRGGRMWVHYAGPVPGRTVPAWQVLDPAAAAPDLAARIEGHVVLVGTGAAGLKDLRATPLEPFAAGVSIHAEAIEQMLTGRFLSRPGWAAGAELAAAAALGLALAAAFAALPARWGAALAAAAVAAPVAGAWLAFRREGLLLDPVGLPATALAVYVGVSSAGYARTERERGRIRGAFASYLAPAVVDALVERPDRLRLGGETRELTFLFTDVAGFTALVERLEPERLVELLNAYLDGVCRVVTDHGGTIDKIVGDAVHVIFNAPLDQPDHPARAVRCALAVDAFARGFAAERGRRGVAFGATRVGVNTGPAVVGNFGGRRRLDYTAHGDAINTAARLEGANKHLGTTVCVAGSTAARCGDGFAFRPVGTLALVGKSGGVEAFEPIPAGAARSPPVLAYRAAFEALREGDPAAGGLFAALAAAHPDDPLARLHAARATGGELGTAIRLSGK